MPQHATPTSVFIIYGVFVEIGDLGQSSWMSVKELNDMMSKLGVTKNTKLLEIGSGAGGTSVYIAKKYGCTINGVDLNPHGALLHENNNKPYI